MGTAVVVPDTGVLVARGLGKDVDPACESATQALARCLGAGARLVVPPSVTGELDRVLAKFDEVFDLLQQATRQIASRSPAPSGLAAAEGVILDLAKQVNRGPGARFLDAITTETSRVVQAYPSLPLSTAFASVVGTVLMWKHGIAEAARPPKAEFLPWPDPDPSPLATPIPEVRGDDLAHLRSCQAIGERLGSDVVFLVLERPVFRHKDEVNAAFPKVRVTTPAFLPAYL